ncbi:hypothetical protein CABS01_10712 [Colletotrichum abscissum]|uniref:Uncharacterized protein n=1 Tax=Colletotrichum abscissum TaxID=1671311 RepID=A0A9P9XNL4_9PEZI|nr:uncharacterized protein CABS01_10712 [Colletotrichum abscissum]KAI3557425.1 hypothetical protein CABS02_02529 [Colletotrichum abscissum]KAK1497734.1 hypothetical protein CABS01_10712 [Colletotrichum abscissum]
MEKKMDTRRNFTTIKSIPQRRQPILVVASNIHQQCLRIPRIAGAASAVGLPHPEPRHELPPPPRPPPHSSSSSPSKRPRALSASLSLLAKLIDGH